MYMRYPTQLQLIILKCAIYDYIYYKSDGKSKNKRVK